MNLFSIGFFMQPSLVLKELKELRKQWKKQDLSFTPEQRVKYDHLIELRRLRVQSF